jgi:two-component system, LytTR family, response regulator LytT
LGDVLQDSNLSKYYFVIGGDNVNQISNADNLLEIFTEIFPKDTSIAVADSRVYKYYQPSPVIDLNIKPGDQIKEGGAAHKAISLKRKVFSYIDSSVFGVSYFGLSVPIIERGKPESCVTAIFPVRTNHSLPKFFTIKNGDRWYPIAVNEILYLEAENRKAKIVTNNKEGYHKLNLSDIEFLLPSNLFIRCHRSFIVNINEIAEIQPDFHSTFLLIMKNGDRIPVSQSYASYFRKSLMY